MIRPFGLFAWRPVRGEVWPVVWSIVVTAGSLIVVLALGLTGQPLLIGVALVLLGGIMMLSALGLERTATSLIVGGVVAAPMTSVVLPGASFVTVADLLFVIGFGLLAPTLLGRPLTVSTPFAVGASSLVVLGFVSALLSPMLLASLNIHIRVVLAMVALPLLFVWWAPGRRTLIALAAAYLLGVTLSLLYGLANGADPLTGRYIGLSEQPTAFGYASLFGISLIPFLWDTVRPSLRFLLVGGIGACLMTTWLAGSRTSLAVILLMAAVYPVAVRSWRLMALVSFGAIIAIANLDRILGAEGGNALSRLIGGAGSRGSDEARTEGLRNGIATFREHPVLGAGWSFDIILAHNIYVQVAAALGVVGLIAFLAYLWGTVRPLRVLERPYNRLAYPALVYVISGPITPNVGSRYVSVTLAFGLAAAALARRTGEIGSSDDHVLSSMPSAAMTTPHSGR